MICPKCQNDMVAIEYEGVEVDRCKSCQGIWFDVGESDWLRDDVSAVAESEPASLVISTVNS